jgi:sec-independent protein translocase protein TatB
MFSVSTAHIVILLLVALFVLGPERLPSAAAWLGRATRRVRKYADDTRNHLRSELGSDFDQFREPLEQLNTLRSFDPRRAVTSYLFDDAPAKPVSGAGAARTNGTDATKPDVAPPTPPPRLQQGEEPPFDAEAT